MRRKQWDTLPDEVERVREGFAQWRQTRPGRSRIPEELWAAATALARSHGVHRIAKALGLSDHALRRRLLETLPSATASQAASSPETSSHVSTPESEHATQKSPASPSPTLIELPWPAPPAAPAACCRIELRQPGGAQMTITLEGASGAATPCGLDLAALVRAFGGGSP